MDTIGSLDLAWVQGYDAGKAEYIDRNVICFKCGKHIKFVDADGRQIVLTSPGDGIGQMAVHHLNRMIAFSDLSIQPKIYVYQYPTMREICQLEGGAHLEFNCLAFSASEHLASLSGLPDYKLTIWNFMTGTKLCTADLSRHMPTSVGFNMANWRQLCITTRKELTLLSIEQCDKAYIIKSDKIKLPSEDWTGPVDDERDELLTRASTRMSKMTIELPRNTVAGVMGEQAEKFEDYQDDKVKVVPVSHCWTPGGDIYIGCEGGQLLQVSGEGYHVTVLYNPGPRSLTNLSRGLSSIQLGDRGESNISEELKSSPSAGIANTPADGAFNSLALHKMGLFAGGEDGTIRQFAVEHDRIKLLESYPLGQDVTSLSFNQPYAKLAVGTSKGAIFIYDPSDTGNCQEFMDTHHGNFVGVDVLAPGTEYAASVREDGEVQIWQLDNPKLVSYCPISMQATSLACSPLAHIVAVGTGSGHLYILDFNKMDNPRIIHREHLHGGPLNHIAFESFGQFLVTGSDDGHIFVLDGRPSQEFRILGHTEVEGEVQSITMYTADKNAEVKVAATTNITNQKWTAATKLVTFALNREMLKGDAVKQFHENLKLEFADDAINKMVLNFSVPSFGAAVTKENTVYSLAQNSKHIYKLVLPTEKPKKASSKDSFLHPQDDYPAHQLAGGRVFMSPNHKWVASCGKDGQMFVRTLSAMDRSVVVAPHDYPSGGIHTCAFSADGQYLLTTGNDGVLANFKWNFSGSGGSEGKSAVEALRARQMSILKEMQKEDEVVMSRSDWTLPAVASRPTTTAAEEKADIEKEEAMQNDQIYSTPTPVPSASATWLDIKEIEAIKEEDKAYADMKHGLRTEIRDMRRKLQSMMRENQDVPDIEKLGHHEFDLDIEEQNRLQAEGEAEVEKIREDKEFDNLATQYIREVIKQECWDDMVVKGRALGAFQRDLMVQNYPMRKRSEEELEKLAEVTNQRKIELAELKGRQDITELTGKPNTQLSVRKLLAQKFNMEDSMYDDDNDSMTDDEFNEGDDEEKDHPSVSGSLVSSIEGVAGKFGGGNDLLHSQFELHSREQKMNQIVLLEDAIHRIKMNFNKEFDEVFGRKEQEMTKIMDKNRRIRKILHDLELQEDVWEPLFSILEKPDRLLEVKDEEVKVEKFLTAEQRKQLEKEQKEEEERRLREKGDNARERALDMMMGGVLEVKKEDELKKDIPVPAFMQNKAEEEWSEDEKKLAQEYEKKVKELQEEREKYKKQLETELKKLQGFIQEGCTMFDDTLKALFDRKIKTEMVIFQEELKIMRLKYSLLLEEELNTREAELNDLLNFKKDAKHLADVAYIAAKNNVEQFREQYDILGAEDKVMDKQFKRDFHDCTALQVDQLYKLFRRRPRGRAAPLKGSTSTSDTPAFDPSSGNPFADRPSTARQNELAKSSLEASLADLDKISNAPEGVEPPVWERMCLLRRHKIESEQLLRNKALVLADMQAYMNKRLEEFDQLKADEEELVQAINKLKDDRMRYTCNLEVQLLLKQGQVEVDAGPFIHDYRHSILIHRGVVEDLNGRIRHLGESKINSMVESKDFRKGIIQLEWEHKRMIMEMEDLQNKMRDIQNLKVTREIQAFLNEEDHEAKKAQEIAILEQTIALQKQHHERNVNEKKRILKELKKTIREKSFDNNKLEDELGEMNVSVSERRNVNEVNKDKRSDEGAEKRYREIVQRRKLVDLAKAQAQEVAVLRAEVERLRMRTFPALVQVEH